MGEGEADGKLGKARVILVLATCVPFTESTEKAAECMNFVELWTVLVGLRSDSCRYDMRHDPSSDPDIRISFMSGGG